MGHLLNLIGKIITDISTSQGTYYPLSIKDTPPQVVDEVFITIEDYRLSISNKITLDPNTTDIGSFIGKKIKTVQETHQEIKIINTDNNWIVVDLRDEAYVGPEAMSLNGPNNLCVVWN
jgi:hypothetical protein